MPQTLEEHMHNLADSDSEDDDDGSQDSFRHLQEDEEEVVGVSKDCLCNASSETFIFFIYFVLMLSYTKCRYWSFTVTSVGCVFFRLCHTWQFVQ